MLKELNSIIAENEERINATKGIFNPITGNGSVGERFLFTLTDYPIPQQYLPISMRDIPLVKQLSETRSIDQFLEKTFPEPFDSMESYERARQSVIDNFMRLRIRHDFPYWAALYIWIRPKEGGSEVLFRLNRPQRKVLAILEGMRLQNKPIRFILLKARQWGGSTLIQIYMMWLQLVIKKGLNSLIIAHQSSATDEVKGMFARAIKEYPTGLLYDIGEDYREDEPKFVGEGRSGAIYNIPQRSCSIRLGTAERPDSSRSGNYSLAHFSEVGIWKETDGKSPEDIIRAACAGILYKPLTFIGFESTANGVGTYFHAEYQAAKDGISQFVAIFISWYEIEQYSMPFDTELQRDEFIEELVQNRLNENPLSPRQTTGKYLWWLWEKGATLEAIHWYVTERAKYNTDEQMMAEFPTDDIEAFVYSGAKVFDRYAVDAMRPTCRKPMAIGDVYGDKTDGEEALSNVRFKEDKQAQLWVWDYPDIDPNEKVTDRYLVVVDVGGRSAKSDWSVIVVFDRLFMIDGEKPMVVAQWYGHIDMDILAWKAAQIAAYYDNALLVIESNTLETHDRDRVVDGDQSAFILNQIRDIYPNLYARAQSPEAIAQGLPVRYGFHTNVYTKPMIISTLIMVVRENLYIERDERCLDEFLCYEKKPNGAFGAIKGKHDDLLMTRAIGLHICIYEMEFPRIVNANLLQRNPNRRHTMTAATI